MTLKTIEEKIVAKVIRRGRGAVFFGTEFLDVGHSDAVCQALSRLARAGTIRRIGTALIVSLWVIMAFCIIAVAAGFLQVFCGRMGELFKAKSR